MRKIVQISATHWPECSDGTGNMMLIALADDGTAWTKYYAGSDDFGPWIKIPSLPTENPTPESAP